MVSGRWHVFKRWQYMFLPSDLINLSFISFLLIVSLVFSNRVQNWNLLAPLYLGMLLTAICLIRFNRGTPTPGSAFLRRWYPLAFVITVFFSLRWIVHHVLSYDVDSQLIALDYAMFGTHPTVFLSRFLNPYLVDALEICYASFYFLPVILGLFLYFRGRMREFEEFCATVCLGFYISYIGNMLFPACGPRTTLVALHTIPLEAKWVGGFIRTLLATIEPYPWDCFPSGHTAVTLITLVICYRFERRLFWWMLPVGSGLIASTVLLRYHYVADILAGVILAITLLILGRAIQRAWRNYLPE